MGTQLSEAIRRKLVAWEQQVETRRLFEQRLKEAARKKAVEQQNERVIAAAEEAFKQELRRLHGMREMGILSPEGLAQGRAAAATKLESDLAWSHAFDADLKKLLNSR